MITDNTTNAIQQYAYNISLGAVVEPVNGSWIQALCLYLGITAPVNNSWMQALCNYYGITEPLHSSWVIALANYYGITTPYPYGTWWMAIAELAGGGPPVIPMIWNLDTNLWENETRTWN